MARGPRPSGAAITIRAVAERAGVSSMTVSYVLNESKPVRPTTRAAVLNAVAELGYIPNAAARELATARSTRIGVLYFDTSHTFVSAMLAGALSAAARTGAQVIARQCASFAIENTGPALLSLVQEGANGILIYPPISGILTGTETMARLGVPVCVIAQGDPLPDMDTVGLDEVGAAQGMTAYLLARGHRRIGFLTGDLEHASALKRLEGYKAALREHGVEVDPALIAQADYRFEGGAAATHQLLDLPRRPTAIFASNDDMAAAAVAVAHRQGLDVPRDITVVGFDDTALATTVWPPLTTIRQPVAEMSRDAVLMLAEAMRLEAEGKPAVIARELMDFALVRRQSDGRPSTEKPS